MEQLQEFLTDDSALGVSPEDGAELLEPELLEHEETAEEAASTDDPVRVYLREMGSVRLLNRQGEVHLAKGMERGKLRIRKALSRSPVVWECVVAIQEEVRSGQIRLEDIVAVGMHDDDEAVNKRARAEVTRRFTKFAGLKHEIVTLGSKIDSMPERYAKAKARKRSELVRLKIRCSQAMRAIPFNSAHWRKFQVALENTLEEIARLEREL